MTFPAIPHSADAAHRWQDVYRDAPQEPTAAGLRATIEMRAEYLRLAIQEAAWHASRGRDAKAASWLSAAQRELREMAACEAALAEVERYHALCAGERRAPADLERAMERGDK